MALYSQRLCVLLRRCSLLRTPIQHCVTSYNNSTSHRPDEISTEKESKTEFQFSRSNKKRGSRLHNRRLTEDEININKKQHEKLLSMDESDSFGSLELGKSEQKEQFSFGGQGGGSSDLMVGYGENVQEKGFTKRRIFKGVTNDRRHSDKFGSLADTSEQMGTESLFTEIGSHNERFADDSDRDGDFHIRLKDFNKKDIEWYGRLIERLGREGKITEAIAVLEERMLKRDRVRPSQYTFTALIGVLGRVGYTKKAFKLFNQMKKMGLQPVDPTYTALFNACANSPWKSDGLQRANKLKMLMEVNNYEPNLLTYHAMIKTFGVLGDIRTAFSLMDELTRRFRPTNETFSFLLMACISDTKAGFKHAIEVWSQLQKYRITPDAPLFNLLLRSVRDCQAGDPVLINQLIQRRQQLDPNLSISHTENKQIGTNATNKTASVPGNTASVSNNTVEVADKQGMSAVTQSDTPSDGSTVTASEWWENSSEDSLSNLPAHVDHPLTSDLPNLLDPACDLSRVVSIGPLTEAVDRLAVIGGVHGVLEAMEQHGAEPDIRTFSQLMEVVPPTLEAEAALLAKMKSLRVKPDIQLFNTVIHRRCLRRDGQAARAVLQEISASHLYPDMKTFGCLAMTCRNKQDGARFLEDMEHNGLSPNIEVLGTLSYASNLDFGYKLMVLQYVADLDLRPNDKFIEVVEGSIDKAKHKIVQVESGELVDGYISSDYFNSTFTKFMSYYEGWLHRTRIHERPHPWAAFRDPQNRN